MRAILPVILALVACNAKPETPVEQPGRWWCGGGVRYIQEPEHVYVATSQFCARSEDACTRINDNAACFNWEIAFCPADVTPEQERSGVCGLDRGICTREFIQGCNSKS